MPYTMGVLEGFQAAREADEQRNYDRELQNRQFADRVFGHLLQSNDPEMRALALSGLAEPITGAKKKGFAGYLGQYRETNPIYESAFARMNERIPDTGVGGGPAPPVPGSAGMSSNAPVEPGSAPIQMPGSPMPPEPPPFQGGGSGGLGAGASPAAPSPAQVGPTNEVGPTGLGTPPPGAPMESRFKRRGTGVPTAEEIAEMNARVPIEQKIKVAVAQLTQAGATPEEIQQTIMGMLGAPQNQRFLQQVTQWGVKVPGSDIVQPVLLDTSGRGYVLPGGQNLPAGSQMVRMSGGGGAGGSITSKIPDSDDGRNYLVAQGVNPQEIAAGSPTGYWKVVTKPDGTVGVQPDMYTPPPAYSGTATIGDASGNQTVVGVPRQGVPGNVIGTATAQQPSTDQSAAQALLADVQARIAAAETPEFPGLPRRMQSPLQRDEIVRQAAIAAGLPYTTYFELEKATRVAPARQVTPRPNAPAGTAPTTTTSQVERVRQRILTQRGGPTPPPPASPRVGGPGPVGAKP